MISVPNHSLKLAKILATHAKYSGTKNTFPQILGDGYLYNHNSIFKNVRDFAVGSGCNFTTNPSFPYYSFSTLALKEILAQNEVPLMDNVFYLKNFEAIRPNKFRVRDLFDLGPVQNLILHESAHLVSFGVLKKHLSPLPAFQKSELQMVAMMLSEAFAITVENLALNYLDKTAIDEWFFQKNAYLSIRVPGLEWIADKIGIHSTAKLLMLMFLDINFFNSELSKPDQAKIFELARIEPKIRQSKRFIQNFKLIRRRSTSFNPAYRVQTTTLYTQYLGSTKSLTSLFNFNPLTLVENTPEALTAIEELVHVIECGTK